MANYTVAPTNTAVDIINDIFFPVPYVGENGFAAYTYLSEISAQKTIPLMPSVSTAEFTSGNYTSFTAPPITIGANNLPCFDVSEVILSPDDITIYRPHAGYIIGSPTDQMTGNFSVNIYPTNYSSNSVIIPPLGVEQSLRIVIYKASGATINFSGSNIANNGMDDSWISPATRIEFEIEANNTGAYVITRWIAPNVQDAQVGTQRLIEQSVTQAILALQSVGTPQLIPNAVTQAILALQSVGTPQLIPNAVTQAILAPDSVDYTKGNSSFLGNFTNSSFPTTGLQTYLNGISDVTNCALINFAIVSYYVCQGLGITNKPGVYNYLITLSSSNSRYNVEFELLVPPSDTPWIIAEAYNHAFNITNSRVIFYSVCNQTNEATAPQRIGVTLQSVQSALGFTPVQQGGAPLGGMTNDKVYLGRSLSNNQRLVFQTGSSAANELANWPVAGRDLAAGAAAENLGNGGVTASLLATGAALANLNGAAVLVSNFRLISFSTVWNGTTWNVSGISKSDPTLPTPTIQTVSSDLTLYIFWDFNTYPNSVLLPAASDTVTPISAPYFPAMFTGLDRFTISGMNKKIVPGNSNGDPVLTNTVLNSVVRKMNFLLSF